MTDNDKVSEEAAIWAVKLLHGDPAPSPETIAPLLALPSNGLMRATVLAGRSADQRLPEGPVDAAVVRWCFRSLLGREPESEGVVTDHLRVPSAAVLVEALLACPEHQQTGQPWKRIEVAGRMRRLAGQGGDLYVDNLAEAAEEMELLARVARAVGRAHGGPIDIVDAGANLGLAAVTLAPEAGRLLCVEPNPACVAALALNLRLNDIHNATIGQAALGAENGQVGFRVGEFSAGSHVADIDRATMQVPLVRLDTLLAQHGMADPAFIKIDCEGFERQVLEGAAGTLARAHPVILAEFNSWALMAFGDTYPLGFLRELVERFPYVHAIWDRRAGQFERVRAGNVLDILYRNLMARGCLDDLVLSDDDRWLQAFE